jgi:Yip1-like protein
MNNMELAWAVIATPRAALSELHERPRFVFPLLLLTISSGVLVAWYYSIVDLPWLIDQTFSANESIARMSEAQRSRALGMMSRGMMLTSSLIGGLIGVVVLKALEALYYVLADRITNLRLTFNHWFALACWTSIPSVIVAIASLLILLTSRTNQISAGALSPLSLNELFFHLPMGAKGSTLLTSLTLIHPWMWWLTALGVRLWTGRSWMFSAGFVLLPVILVCGAAVAISSLF